MLEAGFAKTGRNMGNIHAGKITDDFRPATDRRFLWFDNAALRVARRRARWADQVAGESQQFALLSHGQTALSSDIRGVEPKTMDIRGVPAVAGRGITRTDLDHDRRVIVLGESVRKGIRSVTALHHGFAPSSELALVMINVQEIWVLLDLLFGGLKVFLVGAGVVTLLVGAVGVMNIMLVVVGERVQEIGLRKALGATDRAIFVHFLAEATAVAGLSGSAGALVGYVLVKLTRLTVPEQSVQLSQPVFDPQTAAFVVLSLVMVGIVAGIIPALRAARVPPAESLRAI